QPHSAHFRIRESEFTDSFLNRHLSAGIPSGKRMSSHPKELKDNDGKSKRVVIDSPHDCIESLSLEFRRRVFRHTYKAQEVPICLFNLKRVSVDKRCLCI